MNLDNFNKLVGQTIMECQRIEHDVKLICAGVLDGDMEQNYRSIEFKSLGEVLLELKTLDKSCKKFNITKADYDLLFQIKEVRNWLAHSVYVDFMYEQAPNLQKYYNQTIDKLQSFYVQIKGLGNQLEKSRLEILKYYGRI